MLDGAGLGVRSHEYEWHREPGAASECPWAFLKRLDVAYAFTRQRGFDHWPREYLTMLPQLEPLDATGRALYVELVLVRRRAADPACAPGR